LESSNPGSWAKELKIIIDYEIDKDKQKKKDETLFRLSVTDKKTGAKEVFTNLSADIQKPRFITKVLEEESNLIRVKDPGQSFEAKRPAEWTFDPSDVPTGIVTDSSDGEPLEDNDIIPKPVRIPKTGLYLLEDVDLINMLCIPPYGKDSNTTPVATYESAIKFCNDPRRIMLIIDPPESWNDKSKPIDDETWGIDATGGKAFNVTRDKNSIIYFPRIRAPDPLDENRLREFVPCGAIAGVIARTDSERGFWKAPAGIEATLNGVSDLTVRLTDAENGELNPKGINCLRIMPAAGRIVWGARTLRGDDRLADQWKYLPVRRTALYIEESLYRGTQWVVFEPNDEPLWAQIRLNVGAFMHDLYRKGAFQGTTPKDAYLVKCDKETTTQSDVDRGIVNILVGFAPLKPAEFVVLQIQQLAGKGQEAQ